MNKINKIHFEDDLMRALISLTLIAISIIPAFGMEYYVDNQTGNDANQGTAPGSAWASLDRINAFEFKPGDRVLFKAGCVWKGQLAVHSSGEARNPIRYAAYGEGGMPRIDADGAFEDGVLIHNAEYVEIGGLEITNHGEGEAMRRGVHLLAENAGTLHGVVISGLFIHDVNGTEKRKDSGGIIFRTRGERTPTRFDGLRIERNIVWKVDRSGIAAQSSHWKRTAWFPSLNVTIRENWVGGAGGDGVVPWATDGALVEYNIVQGANERAGSYNAGIWPWSTDNSLFRFNRASGVKTTLDGQGFDSDYNSRNSVFEYNLSHDNEGGFFLICSPGGRDPKDNLGNQGTIVRNNISKNDRARIFHVSAADDTLVEHNAIYTEDADIQMVIVTDWSGWADGLHFKNNLFQSGGGALYGHGASHEKDGTYGIADGWAPAKNVTFEGNRYLGEHHNPPEDANREAPNAPSPIEFDWPGPQFDPHHPETFDTYMDRHKVWIADLMKKQFGEISGG